MIVYKFGCRFPSHRDIAIIRDQLFRANRYRNRLIELELARRAARDFGADPDAIKQARSEESRQVRAALVDERGALGSGTYLLIEADVKRASRERTPRFRRCDFTGRLGATIPTARAQKPVVGVWSKAFRLEHVEGPYYLAHLSLGRGMVVTLPTKVHRPLPPGAPIIGVTLHVERAGTAIWKYSLAVTLDQERAARPTGNGHCAINFGWRRMPSGNVRVATCQGDDGRTTFLELPARMISACAHRESLRSLADEHAAAFLGDSRRRAKCRERFLLEAAHTGVKRSERRARRRRERGTEHFDPASASRDNLDDRDHWAQRDRHLQSWERDAETKFLHHRREIYRLWVRQIAQQYAEVTVEAFDLRRVLERSVIDDLPTPDRKLAERANRLRFLVGPSYLRQEIQGVFRDGCRLAYLRAATQTCHACGRRCHFDAARQLEHVCEHCGAAWDQDVNNAENQLSVSAAE